MTFEEVDAKLTLLKTNMKENPLPVASRLEMDQRISEFGPEIARLKHIQELKLKDEIAAQIYDQLSTGDKIIGEKYVVRELHLTLKGEDYFDTLYIRRFVRTFEHH